MAQWSKKVVVCKCSMKGSKTLDSHYSNNYTFQKRQEFSVINQVFCRSVPGIIKKITKKINSWLVCVRSNWVFFTRREELFHTYLPLTLEKPSVFSVSYARKGGVWWSKGTKNRVCERSACPPLGHHTTPVFREPRRTKCETLHPQGGGRKTCKKEATVEKLEAWTTGSHLFSQLTSNVQSSTFPDASDQTFSHTIGHWRQESLPLHQF